MLAAAASLQRRRDQLGIKPADPLPVKALVTSFAHRVDSIPAIDDAELARIREAEERERREHKWKALCATECRAYSDATLERFNTPTNDARSVVAAVRDYTRDMPGRRERGEGFVFFGPCGTGKDHLAMSILRVAVLEHGFYCLRINGPEWYGRLRDLMSQDSSKESDEIKRLGDADFLLVSDPLPPMGDLSPYQAAMLYRVMERRQANRLPTIVTVNSEGRTEADRRMGVPTVDRMVARSFVAACNWDSHRQPLRRVGFEAKSQGVSK